MISNTKIQNIFKYIFLFIVGGLHFMRLEDYYAQENLS